MNNVDSLGSMVAQDSSGKRVKELTMADGRVLHSMRVRENGTYVLCDEATGQLGTLGYDEGKAGLRRGQVVWRYATQVLERVRGAGGHQIWKALDGRQFLVRRMAQSHLENAWHMLERRLIKLESRSGTGRDAREVSLWIKTLGDEMARRERGR